MHLSSNAHRKEREAHTHTQWSNGEVTVTSLDTAIHNWGMESVNIFFHFSQKRTYFLDQWCWWTLGCQHFQLLTLKFNVHSRIVHSFGWKFLLHLSLSFAWLNMEHFYSHQISLKQYFIPFFFFSFWILYFHLHFQLE